MAGLAAEDAIVVPDQNLQNAGIEVIEGEVVRLDANGRTVTLASGDTLGYDKLFLATGASPVMPPIEGRDLEGVLTLRGLPDACNIKTYFSEKKPKRVVFIGAGFITLEVASLLAATAKEKMDITIVELMDRPLPLMLDGDMAALVKEHLEEKGLRVMTGEKVEKIIGKGGKVSGVVLASGKELPAEMVFMNIGTRPNLELAKNIGLDTGQFGIKVTQHQETSDPNILAAAIVWKKSISSPASRCPGNCAGLPSSRGAWRPNAWPVMTSRFPVCSTPAGVSFLNGWPPQRALPRKKQPKRALTPFQRRWIREANTV